MQEIFLLNLEMYYKINLESKANSRFSIFIQQQCNDNGTCLQSLVYYQDSYFSKYTCAFVQQYHTSWNGQNKQTKILTFEITIFGLKNDGEKWSRKIYFEIPCAPSELLLPSAEKSAQKG